MKGYWNLPEVNAETLLPGGWLATGDIGELDDKGRLKITDRKKDLVKTSGGKYIAPGQIAAQFKVISALASNLVVHAADRNYATALISLDPEALEKFAAENGPDRRLRRPCRSPRRSAQRCRPTSTRSTRA